MRKNVHANCFPSAHSAMQMDVPIWMMLWIHGAFSMEMERSHSGKKWRLVLTNFVQKAQRRFAEEMPSMTLKIVIILWALFVIGLALWIDNPWILAGILAYEVLP